MLVVGLTGSIGMGKSTTADMFAQLGVPVHDADRTVHQLYRQDSVVDDIEALFPGTTHDGQVSRSALGAVVLADPQALKRLEALVHPLVRKAETAFLDHCRSAGVPYVIIDIPLLFETDQADRFDAIIVVTANADIQRKRVLAREGMTAQKFEAIIKKQVPDADKRARADFIVCTDSGLDAARSQVAEIHTQLCKRAGKEPV